MIILALAVAIIPAGQAFACTPVRLWDGDGPIWCAEGPHVRLSGIAAREMDGSCRSNQPCPSASATEARDTLARLLGTPAGSTRDGHVLLRRASTLRCVSDGGAGGTRTAAWCQGPVGDISCRMVATGTVLRWDRYWRGHRC